jgi:hypothetical protein
MNDTNPPETKPTRRYSKKSRKRRKKTGPKGGQPTLYTKKLADLICEQLAGGMSLTAICKQDGFPGYGTVMKWLWRKSDFLEDFKACYEEARQQQAEYMADHCIDIADDGSNDYVEKVRKDGSTYMALNSENIQRSRLKVDTRKWAAAHLRPKKWGDKVILGGDDESGPIKFNVIYENKPIRNEDED